MTKIKKICEESFENVIKDVNENYHKFLSVTKQKQKDLIWKAKVTDFKELYKEAELIHGKEFTNKYNGKILEIRDSIQNEKETIITANFALVDFVYNYIEDLSPRVVIGLIPPYYPNVSNVFMEKQNAEVSEIYDNLNEFTQRVFGQKYDVENFYTGISDLSYSSIKDGEAVYNALKDGMPFFENIYHLPIREVENISMPCINIGPWGKDFHKLTERVLKEDLYVRTPAILDYAVKRILA